MVVLSVACVRLVVGGGLIVVPPHHEGVEVLVNRAKSEVGLVGREEVDGRSHEGHRGGCKG